MRPKIDVDGLGAKIAEDIERAMRTHVSERFPSDYMTAADLTKVACLAGSAAAVNVLAVLHEAGVIEIVEAEQKR